MTVRQYVEAISEFDPGKPKAEVRQYVGRGCDVPAAFLEDGVAFPCGTFVENMKRGLCKRSTHAFHGDS